MTDRVKFKEHDLNDPGLFLGTVRDLAQAGKYEDAQRLIQERRAKEQAKAKDERKSRILEYIDQVDLDNIDLDGLETQFEIEKTYNRSAPTWRDFLVNTPDKIEYFIDGMIMENARVYLVSESKFGKSFLTLYMAICVASGNPFLGRVVEPCPVMMIDQENALSLNNWRARAIAHGLNLSQSLPDLPIMPLFHEGISLTDEASIDRLKRYISDYKPGLITVDTLIRCTRGLKERDADDMNEVAEVIAKLKRDTGQDFVFLFLHHATKDKDATGQARVRGSGDITAMVDHGFMLSKVTAANGSETFGLTETSARHVQAEDIYYRIASNKTARGDMVEFIEITENGIQKGETDGEGDQFNGVI